jgi:Family of unknown function (DUF6582)
MMSTARQKEAAKKNVAKARRASHGSHRGRARGLSSARENDLKDSAFAFPKERKEPLVDAKHVRNAVARFNQVEDVSDRERDAAWRRIRSAARRFGVQISVRGWRQLSHSGKAR